MKAAQKKLILIESPVYLNICQIKHVQSYQNIVFTHIQYAFLNTENNF
jgi:hypothetical protein